MYFFRDNYKLHDYITDEHFDKLGRLLVLVSLVYLYFNVNEFLVPGFKEAPHSHTHLQELLMGKHAFLFWGTQFIGLLLPIIFLMFTNSNGQFLNIQIYSIQSNLYVIH